MKVMCAIGDPTTFSSVMYDRATIGAAVQAHIDAKFGAKSGYDKVAAYELNLHRVNLSQILHGRRPPTKKVLDDMGLEKKVVYVPKEKP